MALTVATSLLGVAFKRQRDASQAVTYSGVAEAW